MPRRPAEFFLGRLICVILTAVVIFAPVRQAMAIEQTTARSLGVSECLVVVVQTTQDVSSATARAGEFFPFQTINAVTVGSKIVIPQKTPGWGVISVAAAAGAHGAAGTLLLDPRYLLLSGDRRLSVVLDHRAADLRQTGSSGNAPGYLGALPVPGIGVAIGAFNYFHHGNNTTVPKGTIFAVFPSDDPSTAACQKS